MLLFRFDNFEEGAKLTYNRLFFLFGGYWGLRTFAFLLLVLLITKIISNELLYLLSGMILFTARQKILVDWQ